MDNDLEKILIFTYNPKGRLKNNDIEEIENTKVFDWFRSKKHIIVEKNQIILIYISKPIQEIKYLTKVIDINKDTIKLKLIKKFNKLELSYEKLLKNGFKEGSNNIILNNNEQLYKYITNILNNELSQKSENKNMKTKNIMLYGAPGVGKTHNYKRLITMIEKGEPEKNIFDTIYKNETTNDFDNSIYEIIKNEKRIEFVTFHQSYSYEDFIEGFRPQDNGNLKLEDGIFKKLIDVYSKTFECNKDMEIDYKDFIEYYKSKMIEKGKNKDGKYFFSNNHFIDSLEQESFKGFYEDNSEGNSFDLYFTDIEYFLKNNITDPNEIYKYLQDEYISEDKILNEIKAESFAYESKDFPILLEDMKKYLEEYNDVKINKKNFYIVIDEINRGNISKIFGELITLIEEDKRDDYEVTLPYSKEKFKIPSNLYIIATMNSTDKSIATIDIALRRRFTFLKMKPKEELVKNENANKLMKELNNHISNTINEDYQLGHSYFMKIENDKDLEFVKKYKIQPLLEEYFYGDEKNYNKAIEILNIKEDNQ
uniref:McrB family protein n=1 Tax=Aliarcobacter sp. TaxID=2321116 RepID=UPI00404769F9